MNQQNLFKFLDSLVKLFFPCKRILQQSLEVKFMMKYWFK